MATPESAGSLRQALLQQLQQNQWLSGGALSRRLGVSRTAVWKQIQSLKEQGWDIEAVPSKGYRLLVCGGLLDEAWLQQLLQDGCLGHPLQVWSQLPSTNETAMAWARQGCPEGALVVTDQQTAGRGRRGRHWLSPPGVNLYLSVVLRPAISPVQAPQLTFVAALAVKAALENSGVTQVQLKWPNDVLLQEGKVAGILSELSAEAEQVRYVVVGIGVNLNITADQLPERPLYPATSVLQATGKSVERSRFLVTLMGALADYYQLYCRHGFGPIAAAWQQACLWQGSYVQVVDGDARLAGRFAGLAADGALLLEINGRQQSVYSGDVVAMPD